MPGGRRDRVGIGFTILWLTFWAAAILVAIWSFGAAALGGEPAPALFLVVWVGFAGFALASVARGLVRRLLGLRPPPRGPGRNHVWDDGIDPHGPGPAA
jgi:hypothetical protein